MDPSAKTRKPRYIMIGGFLGSGKTTSVANLARELTSRRLKVGLITNDQGHGLVDTAMLRSRGFATEEIPGGCFCCRFNSLLEAANRLTAASRPDVFIAEPVGSCTDLVATVTYPLRRIYGEDFTIAPLSVLVDPVRALRLFDLEPGAKFSPKVTYIYRKQLEEADLIAINKCDLVDGERSAKLRTRLAQEFPRAEIHEVSARTGLGLEKWFARITEFDQPNGAAMEIDYEIYAEGEALLGWLNCTLSVRSGSEFDGNQLISFLAREIQSALRQQGAEVAHLKMTLSPEGGLGDLAAMNLVRNDYIPELSQELASSVSAAELILNLRAEAAPESLSAALSIGLELTRRNYPNVTLALDHLEHFRPGKPEPTHRLTNVA